MATRKRTNARKKTVDTVLNNTSNEVLERVYQRVMMNEVMSRSAIGGRLGITFDGDRNLYDTFGYKTELRYEDYRAFYDRLGMATRIVEKFSNDTWNKPPVLVDGGSRSDDVGSSMTSFLIEWNALVKRVKLYQAMREADIMCGIGKYSVIFLGFPGAFSSPVKKGQAGSLFYVNAYDEKQAEIDTYIKDEKNPMYGMPEFYNINMASYEGSIPGTKKEKVHYTRCIHISENRLGSRVFGRPRLQEVYNTLQDIEKVRGGGAEAAWLAVYMGFLILTREGVDLPEENTEEWRRAEEAIEKFAHRIQRFATLKGVDKVENLGVHEVRIKDIYSVLISDLAGSKGIPQRVLVGSERGELASTQDMHEWNGVIGSRRTNFAEPEILDPVIQRCIDYGVIPPPKNTPVATEWHPVYAMSEQQEADYLFKMSQAAAQLTNGDGTRVLKENEWRGIAHLPPLSEEELMEGKEDSLEEEDKEETITEDEIIENPSNGKLTPVQKKTLSKELVNEQ